MNKDSVVWYPSDESVNESNVRRLMVSHKIETEQDLIQRATEDRSWFWNAVVEDLKLEWSKPYHQVLDESDGLPWTKWFIGGHLNIAYNCLDRHARSSRHTKVACIWEGDDGSVRTLTYGELDKDANRLANGLKSIGVRMGDCVGIFMPMLPETLTAVFACLKIGAIFSPIFSGYGFEAVADRLADCEAKVLITADGFLRRGIEVEMKNTADTAVNLCPSIKNVIVVKRLGNGIHWDAGRDLWWDEIKRSESNVCESEPVDAEHPFMIAYTSGTTGKPKGAVHVHGGFFVKVVAELAYQFDLKEEDTLFWVTDLGWIMGTWEIVGTTALCGTLMIYEGTVDHPAPNRLWSMIERHHVTIFGISPTAIRSLMRNNNNPADEFDLSSLRILGSTGEPWNPEPWKWYFEKVGNRVCPIINISGGTEIGVCFLSPLPTLPLKSCTVGLPSLGVALDIYDSEGVSLKEGIGELVALKPWPGMTRGLWKDPERYLETYWSRWPNVWVHGDWASRDEDGYWYLHGRSDDTIKVAGKRIGPAEIESALVDHPSVLEAAAIGVPHEVKGEAVVCFVVPMPTQEGGEKLEKNLRMQVSQRLGKVMLPERIIFVRALPKTRNGKILRRLIRAKYLGRDDRGSLASLENPDALDDIHP